MSETLAYAATEGDDPDAGYVPLRRRLLRQPLAVACLAYLALVLGAAIIGPILLPHVAGQQVGDLLRTHQGPTRHDLLGTDTVGRDVLNRLIVGSRTEMLGVAEVLVVATLLGFPLGLAAGYVGGRLDRALSWLTDLAFSVPQLILILVVISLFPSSLLAAMVTLGVLTAPGIARIVRAVTLPIRDEQYVAAARVSGLSRFYIVTRHVLPRIAGVVIVQCALIAAGAVGITAGLAFLGVLGTSTPTWGGMVQDGISVLQLQPWLIWPPGVTIGLTVLALVLFGDAVRDANAESWATPVATRRRPPRRGTEAPVQPGAALLAVESLSVSFPAPGGTVAVVEDASWSLQEGETLGIVGESGCGKTMMAMALLGLLPGAGQIEAGRVLYGGRDLVQLSEHELRRIRGKEIALVSQEPMVSLTPTFRVGWQIAEAIRRHHGVGAGQARERTIDLLRRVQLREPELVARRYVHELSGGMAQRVAIARALAGEPRVLIADEPTTALDVTVQAEILDLLRALQQERGMAVLLISHDWGVVADLSDRVIVMYAGQVVEEAPLESVFDRPLHPYTEALLGANPHHTPDARRLPAIPGHVPRPGSWPRGCHFHPRCRYATEACSEGEIPVEHPRRDRSTRCIHHDQVGAAPAGAGRT